MSILILIERNRLATIMLNIFAFYKEDWHLQKKKTNIFNACKLVKTCSSLALFFLIPTNYSQCCKPYNVSNIFNDREDIRNKVG